MFCQYLLVQQRRTVVEVLFDYIVFEKNMPCCYSDNMQQKRALVK